MITLTLKNINYGESVVEVACEKEIYQITYSDLVHFSIGNVKVISTGDITLEQKIDTNTYQEIIEVSTKSFKKNISLEKISSFIALDLKYLEIL